MIPVRTPANIGTVPNKPRTQHRSVRVDDPEWDDLEAAAEHIDLDRAKVINQLIENWLGRPGVEAPQRPSPELMEKIIRLRHIRDAAVPKIALSIPCPTCKVEQGPCITGKNGEHRSHETIHRARLAEATKVFKKEAEQQTGG